MKRTKVFLVLMLFVVFQAFAGTPVKALVIDSGSDLTHPLLKPHANPNLAELNGIKNSDDDNNGYVDDIYGWNFAENNNILVHLEYTPSNYDDILEFMKCLCKYQEGGRDNLSPTEFDYLKTHYNDKAFMKKVGFYGEWSHGTHVAGIIGKNNNSVKLNAIAHLPVGTPPEAQLIADLNELIMYSRFNNRAENQRVTMDQLDNYFKQMGQDYASKMQKEGAYVGMLDPRVINCSFGTSNKALFNNFKKYMTEKWGFTNPSDEEVQHVVNMFVTDALLPRDKVLFGSAKHALIFIAAGNSGENNDNFVISPNSVPIENKIVVLIIKLSGYFSSRSFKILSDLEKFNFFISINALKYLSSSVSPISFSKARIERLSVIRYLTLFLINL
jgi:cell wall-associated protease